MFNIQSIMDLTNNSATNSTLVPFSLVVHLQILSLMVSHTMQSNSAQEAMNASFENSHPPAPTVPPPDVGINEKRVEALQKKCEAQQKPEIEVPEKFKCAITN